MEDSITFASLAARQCAILHLLLGLLILQRLGQAARHGFELNFLRTVLRCSKQAYFVLA